MKVEHKGVCDALLCVTSLRLVTNMLVSVGADSEGSFCPPAET